MNEDRDEADETQSDMYRQPGSNSPNGFDEADPGTPLDDCVELGGDEEKGARVG